MGSPVSGPERDSMSPALLRSMSALLAAALRARGEGRVDVWSYDDASSFDEARNQLRERLARGVRRELLAVSHWGSGSSVADYAPFHETNAECVQRGVRMVSVFDRGRLAVAGGKAEWRFLAGSEEVGYRWGDGPIQVKVVDRETVVLADPLHPDGLSGIMVATGDRVVAAALEYVGVVRRDSVLACKVAAGIDRLTDRQHAIAALLLTHSDDAEVAAAIDVSVRTVRADMAAMYHQLGVTNRFAAGIAYQRMSSPLASWG